MNRVCVIMMMGARLIISVPTASSRTLSVRVWHAILERMHRLLKHLASQPADPPPLPYIEQILIRYDPGRIQIPGGIKSKLFSAALPDEWELGALHPNNWKRAKPGKWISDVLGSGEMSVGPHANFLGVGGGSAAESQHRGLGNRNGR